MSPRRQSLTAELLLRYACATLVTWIALAGAQLIIRNDFILALGFVSLLGVPVSLFLRFKKMRIGSITIPRPLWNSLTVIVFFLVSSIWTLGVMRDMIGLLMSGKGSQLFWLRFGAGESLALLMQIFLLFAAFRSFALISDKDATLATVPSFSVLLLLIPVHKGLEVVLYFVLWTLVAAMLFALDHRSEMREVVAGRIAAPLPGQDVRMAARSLATVLGLALTVAVAFSYFLTSRDPDERSNAETAISNLATRLTQFALSMPDGSPNSGPERQIDFSSGPNLPTRTALWKVTVYDSHLKTLHPLYWRLFTLSDYNGTSWTQKNRGQLSIPRSRFRASDIGFHTSSRPDNPQFLPPAFIPPSVVPPDGRMQPLGQPPSNEFPVAPAGGIDQPRFSPIPPPQPFQYAPSDAPGNDDHPKATLGDYFFPRGPIRSGFRIRQGFPEQKSVFGQPTAKAGELIYSLSPNLGFVPLLPSPIVTFIREPRQTAVRARDDGGLDVGIIQEGGGASALADIPKIEEYGFPGYHAPLSKLSATDNSPRLSPSLRSQYLQLPPTLPNRVREWAHSALRRSKSQDSNLKRAQILATALQDGAVYTLRPPSVPEGHDAADYFLFEGGKRGYCTYFAGALTVACRTQGIPARVVSGFASQEFLPEGAAVLRDANAHAWTEIWIDNWGWAPVDATPADDRGANAPSWSQNWRDWFGYVVDATERWGHARIVAIIGTLVCLMVTSVCWWRRWQLASLWYRLRPGDPKRDLAFERARIARAYDRASHRLARRYRPRSRAETPDEWLYAAQKALPNRPLEAMSELTHVYLQACYAPSLPDSRVVDSILKAAQDRKAF